MHLRIWAAVGGAALAWGTTGVATRAALNDGVPPIAMVTIRAIIATVVLYAVMTSTGRPLRQSRESWRLGWVMAALNLVAPFVLITYAYRYASAGFVGFLIALVPIATALMAHYALDNEPLHVAKLVGLATALAGVGLLLSSGDSGLAESGRPLLAGVLTAAGVVAIAFAGVYAKKHAHTYDPITLTSIQFAIGAGMLIVIGLAAEGMPDGITAWGWTLIVYLSIIGSVVPFVLYYWVLRHVSSTKASMIGYLVPLVALGSGMALLDEELQFGIAFGGMLILAGVLLTDRAERRRARL